MNLTKCLRTLSCPDIELKFESITFDVSGLIKAITILVYLLVLYNPNNVYSQSSRVDLSTSNNNNQSGETIYVLEDDSVLVIYNFYFRHELEAGRPITIEDAKLNGIESITTYVVNGNSRRQKGKAQYFFEDGNSKLEAIYLSHKPDKYINQWTDNKEQILNNGQGIFYQKYMNRVTEFGFDSTTYMIDDSLKNGIYTVWCPNSTKSFYKCSTGQYINGVEQPMRIDYFENGKVNRIYSIVENKKVGEYHEFYDNGLYKEYGNYFNGNRHGYWKSWSEKGVLKEILNYNQGSLNGRYKEFHQNMQLKSIGNYEFGVGQDTIVNFDPITYEKKVKIIKHDAKPYKHGLWTYFDKYGNKIKEVQYNFGIIVNSKRE